MAKSFRKRLVVREVTLDVHWQGLAPLELAQSLVRQSRELILSGSERLRLSSLRIEFCQQKRSERVLLGLGKLGGFAKSAF